MIIKETVTEPVEKIVDVICNQCGKSCQREHNIEFATVNAHWGYGSEHHDGEVYEIHLCETCFDLFIAGLGNPGLVATDQL